MAEIELIKGSFLGIGINRDQQTTHQQAVLGIEAPTDPAATGPEVVYGLRCIKSFDRISAALSVRGGLDIASVFTTGATQSFLEESRISRYRTYIVASCLALLNPQIVLKELSLRPDVAAEVPSLDRDQFIKQYGTGFLRGKQRGGYYFGVICVESTSEEQQREIDIAVSNSGWGANVDMSIMSRLRSISGGLATRVFAIRLGGPTQMPNPTVPDDIIRQVVDFPSLAFGNPVDILGIYSEYEEVFAMKYKQPTGPFGWDKRRSDIRLLGKRYLRLTQLIADFEFVIDHYNDYRLGNGVLFSVAGNMVQGALETVSGETMKNLDREGEVPGQAGSQVIDPVRLQSELRSIIETRDRVVEAADACRVGLPYEVPDLYISSISLPQVTGVNMELQEIKRSLVPAGTIAMWSGPEEALPPGWLLCDGQKGTPDLRDRFIVGSGRQKVNENGPADPIQVFVPSQSVTVQTSEAGDHAHSVSTSAPGTGNRMPQYEIREYSIPRLGASNRPADTFIFNAGAHAHSATFSTSNSFATGFSGRPDWYALAFIMKA